MKALEWFLGTLVAMTLMLGFYGILNNPSIEKLEQVRFERISSQIEIRPDGTAWVHRDSSK